MIKFLKRFVFFFVTVKPVNIVLIFGIKMVRLIFKSFMNNENHFVPVTGKIEVKYDNKKFYMISDGGDSIASRIYWNGINKYEPETIDLFSFLSKNNNNIFDIGANSGIFSLFCASNNANAKVYSFEPVERNFKYLDLNIKENNFENIKAFKCALTDFNGIVKINVPHSITLPLGGSLRNDLDEVMEDVFDVEAICLDTFIERSKIDRVDLMKIDTEGTEHKVLEGGKNTISKYLPVIICEVLPRLAEENLMQFVKKYNYQFFHINDKGFVRKKEIKGDKTLEYHNYLFITEDKLNSYKNYINIIDE